LESCRFEVTFAEACFGLEGDALYKIFVLGCAVVGVVRLGVVVPSDSVEEFEAVVANNT
jgi:hypothetical protein